MSMITCADILFVHNFCHINSTIDCGHTWLKPMPLCMNRIFSLEQTLWI